jgi:hypothetical protein
MENARNAAPLMVRKYDRRGDAYNLCTNDACKHRTKPPGGEPCASRGERDRSRPCGKRGRFSACALGIHVKLYEMKPGSMSPAHPHAGLRRAGLLKLPSRPRAWTARPALLKEENAPPRFPCYGCGRIRARTVPRAARWPSTGIASAPASRGNHREHPGIEVIEQKVEAIPDGPCVVATAR